VNIDSKRLEVLKFLLDHDRESVSEVSRGSGVSQPTVSRIVEEFRDKDLVKTSKKGNMKLVELKKEGFAKDIVQSMTGSRKLFEAAENFVEELKVFSKVNQCMVFGSVARGTAEPDSDVDVLVLIEEDSESLREKIMLKAEKIIEETGFQISPTVMTVEVFEQHKENGSQFYESIKKDLEVLYNDRSS